jgi:adhesin transport system membrane fusion protein
MKNFPTSQDLLRPKLLIPALSIATLATLLVTGIGWASWATVVESSTAHGRVVPSGRLKTVQSVDGGIVRALSVREGDRVEAGTTLAIIDSTQAGATLGENEAATDQLALNAEWMSAILGNRDPHFEPTRWSKRQIERALNEYQTVLEAQQAAIAVLETAENTKKLELDEASGRLDFAERSVALANERLEMLTSLRRSGATSQDSVLSAQSAWVEAEGDLRSLELSIPKLEAAITEIATKRLESNASFRATLSAKLNEAEARLEQLVEAQVGDRGVVDRSVLKSPSAGIVKTVFPASIGEVMQPAQPVFEILPVNDDLLVRARVDPKDIAFIAPGMTATIRLTAYDYAAFGSLTGNVSRIGVDSVEDENGQPYFPVDVKVGNAEIKDGRELLVLPGMVADVHIVTGRKTVLAYLTKPIHRTITTAFRER